MIASIIPIKRLPSSLGIFDYRVPQKLEGALVVGQLVTIPFRTTTLFGIVISLQKTSDSHIQAKYMKEILRIIFHEPTISSVHLQHIVEWSAWYKISPATLLKMSLPPLQKRKLEKTNLLPLVLPKKQKTAALQYHLYNTLHEHANVLERTINGPTLILIPEIHLADEVRQSLPIEFQAQTVVWHSELSIKDQFARWFAWRNGERSILIGTRSAILLPHDHLRTIIIDYEHDEQHKHWDQAPRFHAKDIALFLHETRNTSLHLMSFSPSLASYHALYEKKYQLPEKTLSKSTRLFGINQNLPHLIDMHEERRAGRYAILSDVAKDAIMKSAGDIFLFVQRRGFSTAVGCNSCGHLETCTTCSQPLIFHGEQQKLRCHYCAFQKAMIRTCPNCHAPNVELRGTGTEFVESGLRNFLGDTPNIVIHRIDSDNDRPDAYSEKKRRLIVGTEMAFRYVRWEKTDYILFVDIDKQLQMPEYLATEHVWHRIQEVIFRKTAQTLFHIQTFTPDHLLFKSLREPDRFYRTELQSRKSLHYPPYAYLVRYFYGNLDGSVAKKEAERVHEALKNTLTEAKKNIILHDPIEMHPRYFRKKFWYTIIARLEPKNWQADLKWLNDQIPGNWKVDPNPISLLQP